MALFHFQTQRYMINIDTLKKGLPIAYFQGSQIEFSNFYDVFLSLKIVLSLSNTVKPL